MLKRTRNSFFLKPFFSVVAALTIAVPASADDTEIFDAILASQNKPNILFVLDYSGSMRSDVNGNEILEGDNVTLSKLEVLKSAVDTLLEANAGKINVGIGSLYSHSASGVRWPISDLEDDASIYDPAIPVGTANVADVISAQMERTGAQGATATVNALAEAAAYFRGDEVLHGDKDKQVPDHHKPDTWDGTGYSGGNRFAAIPSSYTPTDAYQSGLDPSQDNYGWCTDYVGGDQQCEGKVTFDCELHPAISGEWSANPDGSGGTWESPERNICKFEHTEVFGTAHYVSPLTQECQTNFIVLISDGEPTRLNNNSTLQSVLSDAGVPAGKIDQCEDLSLTTFAGSGTTEGNCGPEVLDYLATTDINPDIENSNVRTYTVGFSLDGQGKDYLQLLAQSGQGEFYEASKPEELTTALNNVIDSILAGSQNFAELSINVDPNGFAHENRTYFSLFTPSSKSSWNGNLKGYFLDSTGLVDVNGLPATVNDDSGLRFAETAQSFWSSVPDGNEVMIGGASESITDLVEAPAIRNIYTNLGGNDTFVPANIDARIEAANDLITDELMGNPGAAVRSQSLEWLATAPIGDPLHSKPVSILYGDGTKVVYIMTNQGLMHAFDATQPTTPGADPVDVTGGNELFAFMPKELLSNLPALANPTADADHVYGLDGSITRWHEDDGDGIVQDGETVLLVFGMRRGGTSYYALDVSDPTRPEFAWEVSSNDTRFADLAQTWSRASLITVDNGGTNERVLMFGGGYDAATVDGTTSATPGAGNAVYMVDMDGDKVWEIGDTNHTDMIYSIASDLTIIDTDQNGAADRAYFGDVGGQVWRVDFDDITATPDVKKFADVSNGDHQPIFYAPSVSMNRDKSGRFLAVSFGTGDRTQPMLTNTGNALYMLRDRDIDKKNPDPAFTTIQSTDIYDATANDVGSDDEAVSAAAKVALDNARGWAVFLNTGEKSLSKIITFEGKFLATTFEPDPNLVSGVPDPCSFNMIGRLYVMSILDAQPIQIAVDGSESIASPDASKRTTTLSENMTIPGSPVIHYSEDSSKVNVVVGKEVVSAVNKKLRMVFWHSK